MSARTLLVSSLLFPLLAGADVPPPDSYKERCTIKDQCDSGEEGRMCSANYNAPESCAKTMPEGFSRRCKTYGASVWSEVWCGAKSKPKAPPAKK